MVRSRSGFTFVELLVVVLIIGILAAIVLPKFGSVADKARLATLRSDVRNAKWAEESYYADHGGYGTSAQLLADDLFKASPNTAMVVIAAGSAGYQATASNAAITSGAKSCSVRVGSGVAGAINGVITCP